MPAGFVLVVVPDGGGQDVQHVEVGDPSDGGASAIEANHELIPGRPGERAELLIHRLRDFIASDCDRSFVVVFQVLEESVENFTDLHRDHAPSRCEARWGGEGLSRVRRKSGPHSLSTPLEPSRTPSVSS